MQSVRRTYQKGVVDRVRELADLTEPQHPDHRPPYLHLMPLSEIIMTALGHASINTKGVQDAWNGLLERFGDELNVLLYADPESMDFIDKRIVDAIIAFRERKVILHPGGGGKYGWIEMPEEKKEEAKDNRKGQSSLFDF